MGLNSRRGFVQQVAWGGIALYGCPLKVLTDIREMFESHEENSAPVDSAAIRKLASEISRRVITPDYDAARVGL